MCGLLGLLVFLGGNDAEAQPLVQADSPPPDASAPIDFDRDVRPVLADKCFRCHGPDAQARQGDLRLDQRESALRARDGKAAVVPLEPARSELVRRVESTDAEQQMPPLDSKITLSQREREILRRWIEQGAEYRPHWAFVAPRRPVPPAVRTASWPRDPLDSFILEPLERAGLTISPAADRATWLRRVSLDLNGLPPTVEQLDEYLADNEPDAAERVIDRLLASPAWGERMAVEWLDLARYADTNGYFGDNPRSIWPWRDWVIQALNQGLPYDQFTIRQLAGDLLPQPARDDRVATGFHRNHMMNDETGLIDEEYRVEYVADRVETTATTWLGLTLGCARCHDHKYDPFSQRDYYGLFAFFNNGPETGLITSRNPPPTLEVPSVELQRRVEQLGNQRRDAETAYAAVGESLTKQLAEWEQTASSELNGIPEDKVVFHAALEDESAEVKPNGTTFTFTPGIRGKSASFDGTQHGEVPFAMSWNGPWTVGFWMHSTQSLGCPLSQIEPTGDRRGMEILWQKGRFQIHLVRRWGAEAIVLTSRDPVEKSDWHHVVLRHDGSRKAAGIRLFVDGRQIPLQVRLDSLNDSIDNDQPLRIGRRDSGLGFYGRIDELRVLGRAIADEEVEPWRTSERIRGVLARPNEQRGADLEVLMEYFVGKHASADERVARQRLVAARQAEKAAKEEIPVTLVMQERAERRPTFVLERGQYDSPREAVEPQVPPTMGEWPADLPSNRLGLAHWLVNAKHPLTARVAMNRLWQQMFGVGLVRTPNDFGTQGELPSHPELLDLLATDWVRDGWDTKQIARRIASSAAYGQSSVATESLLRVDPENRKLARGPRFRLSAEQIRDQALAVSGLLVRRVGGPSVRPFQPPGLWEEVSYNGDETYVSDAGEGLWRRSLYTYVKRQAPPPALVGFDGPTREKCVASRARTNTPLQALALWNDPTYVHAARVLAARALVDEDGSATIDAERLKRVFRKVVARYPDEEELRVLMQLLERQRARFRRADQAARQVAARETLDFGAELDQVELAAWTVTLHTLWNLDETITRR